MQNRRSQNIKKRKTEEENETDQTASQKDDPDYIEKVIITSNTSDVHGPISPVPLSTTHPSV